MRWSRLYLGLVLLLGVVLLCLYGNISFEENVEYARNSMLRNPTSFNGSAILFVGEVIDFDTSDYRLLVILQEPPYPSVDVILNSNDSMFQRGDIVEIIGVVEGAYMVSAEDIFLKEPLVSVVSIVRSVPAIPFVLYVFWKTWEFDRKKLCFRRRDQDA